MSEVKTVEERLSAIEYNIEWLTGGYKDLAYERIDVLIKRIEDIHAEVQATFNDIALPCREKQSELVQVINDGIKKLEAARDAHLRTDVAAIVEKVLSDGTHGLVNVPGRGQTFKRLG